MRVVGLRHALVELLWLFVLFGGKVQGKKWSLSEHTL